MKRFWTRALHSLICVRVGQELGYSSDLAQGIAGAIDVAVSLIARICS